MQPKKT